MRDGTFGNRLLRVSRLGVSSIVSLGAARTRHTFEDQRARWWRLR